MTATQKKYYASLFAQTSDIRAIIAPNTRLSETALQSAIEAGQIEITSQEDINAIKSLQPKMQDLSRTRQFFSDFEVTNETELGTAMLAILEG